MKKGYKEKKRKARGEKRNKSIDISNLLDWFPSFFFLSIFSFVSFSLFCRSSFFIRFFIPFFISLSHFLLFLVIYLLPFDLSDGSIADAIGHLFNNNLFPFFFSSFFCFFYLLISRMVQLQRLQDTISNSAYMHNYVLSQKVCLVC